MPPLVDLSAIRSAHERVADAVHRTPLVTSRTLGERIGAPLRLKCENLQKTGAFKVRGALNHMRSLPPERRARGVVTVSAGNHAQAVAWAATAAGVESTVVMPESAPRAKVEASRGYGARVVLHGTVFDAFERAVELSESEGLGFVHPFDDPFVIAGQGTVGLEIVDALPEVATVVVPVGGGGLISGVAAAVRALRPEAAVWGVEPEGADAMSRSLERGEPVHLETVDTIADGLAAPMAGERTLRHVRALVRGVVQVTDDEIREAMGLLLSRCKLLTEPAGAAGVAALLAGRIPTLEGPVVAVLSGGNVDVDGLGSLLAAGA